MTIFSTGWRRVVDFCTNVLTRLTRDTICFVECINHYVTFGNVTVPVYIWELPALMLSIVLVNGSIPLSDRIWHCVWDVKGSTFVLSHTSVK